MAIEDDLRNFMENRLQAFDPTIDLSPNSTAQQKIIDPLIKRFGEDPFSVDIPTFMRDRLVQEFPDLAADGGGLLEDVFSNPLRLLLEPFKREIERIRLHQSKENADTMADEEADALGANFFHDREEGDFSSGVARVYFSAPTTIRITTDRQFTSRSGLAFFPSENVFISSQQMLFNREGDLFFVDVPVQAEATGNEYNISEGELISADDLEGAVRVTNKTAFQNGHERESNEEYLNGTPQALSERSLTTKRGILARTPDTFGTDVRALQVIGAGQEGMDRDVLRGTGEGFLYLVGDCSFYLNWVVVGSILYKDDGPDNDIVLQAGDTIRLILSFSDDSDRTAHEAVISDFISSGVGTANEKHILILDRTIDTAIGTSGAGAVVSIFKPGFITISGVPGGMSTNITVPGNQVHLGGHTDVFVRPSSDQEQEGVLPNLTDDSPILALLDVGTTSGSNLVSSGSNFDTAGVLPGDSLAIETGASAGSYKILSVGSPDLGTQIRIDSLLEDTESGLRARVVRGIRVDLVEPKTPKVPFQSGPVSDLQTSVGSTLFRLKSVNIQSLGAAIGDTIRILDGLNAGDYTITGFDSVLGGLGPIVDRAAPASATNQRYEVFTPADGLEFPLVRLKRLEVLDSTNQGTGIIVPYGDAVDIRPTCDLEGAGDSVRVLDNDILVIPDASSLWGADGSSLAQTFATAASATADARYSKEIAVADGRVRSVSAHASNPISEFEINLPPFLFNGRRDTIMAFTTREDPDFSISTLGDHRTSDIAEAKIGDSIVILDGPNKGNYTIQDLRVLEMWSSTGSGHHKIALVQLDQELPIDPLKTVIEFIEDVGAAAAVTAEELATLFESATNFYSSTFWDTTIVGRLVTTLTDQGFTITNDEAESLLLGLATSGYEVGPSAKGNLRLFFQEPVSAEFYYGEDPTLFKAVSNESLRFRIRPDLDPAQIFPEAEEGTPPTEWNRDLALNDDDTTLAFLTAGSSFVQRGIRDGDVIEFHQAINDLPARKDMQSSWVFVTSAGSNTVRAVFPGPSPASETPDNETGIEPGQLFFIDSGPDVGSYVITEVVNSDFTADPPVVEFKIDRVLTHSTSVYPAATDRDFKSHVQATIITDGNAFPMLLAGETLEITFESTSTAPVTTTHTFGAGPFNSISDVVSDINGDALFLGGFFEAGSDGSELIIRSLLTESPREKLTVGAGSSAIGVGLLQLTAGQSDGGYLGAVTAPETKKIYGSGLSGAVSGQWFSIYAANSPGVLESGDDEAYLGTFEVVTAGSETGGPRDGQDFVELDRSVNFPSPAVEVRWVRHAEPTTDPSDTSGGGKDLSDNYVRGRLYSEVSEQADITIPWLSATVNPVEDDSEEQIDLSVSPVSGRDGYSHKMPYRIVRDDVIQISSTRMSENRQGALYFIDLPVIGIGTLEDLNIGTDVGLLLDGNYKIDGYTLAVDDPIFTFSTQEQVSLILPVSVLPVGSTPDLDNEILLSGQNLQVNYDNAPLIASIQQFFNSPLDRATLANMLVRHFLPSYVYLDVTYTGGVDTSVVAQRLIDYINNIDPDTNELSTDEISEIVRQSGVLKVQQPINIIALTHGTDRRIRGSQSKDVIGGDSLPTFRGNFKQTYFIAGPDTSDEDVRPDREQVFLSRR